MTIGNRVLALLKEKGLKQKDLAEYLHTGSSTINGWKSENRNPSSELIVPICEFLGISCEFLLTGEEHDSGDSSPPGIDPRLLDLIFQINEIQQAEVKGYVHRMLEEPVAADPSNAPEKMAK